jgi:hypothetical protein
VVALGLMVLAVALRDPRYLLTRSFWLDEGWVVDSVRAPLHQLDLLTSSTPIGWTLLLRLVPPVGGPERYRLLPLAFAAACALAAWWLGRLVGGGPGGRASWAWLYGLCCGLAGAASAAVLSHTWLKQYTAEAFVALALAVLLARVERAWSWPSLAAFAAAGVAGFLVSNTAPLVAAAGMGGLWLTSLAGRRWSRLPALAATTAGLTLADGVLYQVLASNGSTLPLRRYWRLRYLSLDDGVGAAAHLVWQRLVAELGSLGWGPWWLALALIGVGLVTLWRAGLPALALAVPAVAAELVVLGFAGAYPFLEPRTVIFYSALLTVTAAAGLATLVRLGLGHRVAAPVAVAGAVLVALLLVHGWVRAGRALRARGAPRPPPEPPRRPGAGHLRRHLLLRLLLARPPDLRAQHRQHRGRLHAQLPRPPRAAHGPPAPQPPGHGRRPGAGPAARPGPGLGGHRLARRAGHPPAPGRGRAVHDPARPGHPGCRRRRALATIAAGEPGEEA